MIRPDARLQVFLCREAVDMRKSIDGLSLLVQEALERNPFVLWYKRLERERFKWPERLDGDVLRLSGQELNWLLDGYDISLMQPHKALHFQSVG